MTGRPVQYPWGRWLDGEEKVLTPSDYAHHMTRGTKLTSLVIQLREQAKKRGMRVSARVVMDDCIELVPVPEESAGRYDWDTLLDGEDHFLTLGTEITASAESFRKMAYAAAKARGRRCSVRVSGSLVRIGTPTPTAADGPDLEYVPS